MRVSWWVGALWLSWGLLLLYGSFTAWIPRPGAYTVIQRGVDLVLIAAGVVVLFRRLW